MKPRHESHIMELVNPPRAISFDLKDDGSIPNSKYPLLIYQGAVKPSPRDPASIFEQLFAGNRWTGSWRDGIYTYHHYHSNTHEAMAVIKGRTTLLLGGENGQQLDIQSGDIIVIPAGVAHKNLGEMKDVICIGGYPEGRDFDMKYGRRAERPQTDRTIEELSLPATVPLAGRADPLLQLIARAGNHTAGSASR